MADPGGIFVKSDDGALYFVRDELLASCKVEGEDLEKWGPVVDGQTPEVEGFSANLQMHAQTTPAGAEGQQPDRGTRPAQDVRHGDVPLVGTSSIDG
jgi:hypothetical protein